MKRTIVSAGYDDATDKEILLVGSMNLLNIGWVVNRLPPDVRKLYGKTSGRLYSFEYESTPPSHFEHTSRLLNRRENFY